MIRRPPRSTLSSSSAASDVYKRQLAAGRGAASEHQPQLLPADRAAGRPRPEQAPSCGRTHPLSPYLQRLAHRAAVANPPLVVRSVASRRWADSPGAVEAARRADSSTRLAPDAGALGAASE